MVHQATPPVALSQQQLAAPQAQPGIIRANRQCRLEIGQRARPVAARRQQGRPRGQAGQHAVIDRQRLAVGALGVIGPAQGFEGAAFVVGDGGVAGAQPCRAFERLEGTVMLAETAETPGQIDLCRGVARQERGGAFQRLTRLGEAAELQPDLAQEMKELPGVWARIRSAREQALSASEVAGRCALQGVAAQRFDLLVGKCHARALAERPAGAKAEGGKEKAGGRQGG